MGKAMWIMVSGPYTSGAKTEADRQENLAAMNRVAYEVLQKGHVPIIGVNMALPVIEAMGEQVFDEVMMPVSLALVERCDAVIRIGGPSKGADDEVTLFGQAGKPVYTDIAMVPNN